MKEINKLGFSPGSSLTQRSFELRLPALAGPWLECKQALAWPELDAHPALEVTCEGDRVQINVVNEQENQLLWYMNRRVHGFLGVRIHEVKEPKQELEAGVEVHLGPLIVDLYRHISSMITDSGRHCVWCGEPLPCPRWWPSLCERNTCVTGFEKTRRPGDLHILMTDPDAATLLVSWASDAAQFVKLKSENPNMCPWTLSLGPSEPPGGWESLGKTLMKLPRPLSGVTPANLEGFLAAVDPDLPLALAWVFHSFRGRLLKLSDGAVTSLFTKGLRKRLKNLTAFVVYPGSSERMRAFSDRLSLASKESEFHFHGSLWPKWHGIIREGLRDFSNSKHMAFKRTNAEDPAGVYMSPHFSLAARYASPYWIPNRPRYEQCCVALCEVVNSDRIARCDNPVNSKNERLETVATDARDVMLRMIIVYDNFPEGRIREELRGLRAAALAEVPKHLDSPEFARVNRAIHKSVGKSVSASECRHVGVVSRSGTCRGSQVTLDRSRAVCGIRKTP